MAVARFRVAGTGSVDGGGELTAASVRVGLGYLLCRLLTNCGGFAFKALTKVSLSKLPKVPLSKLG